ncbi:hypothetical protein U9M48_012265 [Paspalum notatum var. saurae]|uniref:Ribosome-inactivating protein n=1 Tax=Paspalum notatum var. saurae TaxID=547442 RepID=A0AAQ3WHX2_PASNO
MKGGTPLPAAAILLLSLAVVANADILQVSFTTASATAETYKSFISSVRAGIVSTTGGQRSNGIPVLLSKENPNATLTSLNVTLVNKAALSVSLNLDITGAYFAGYEAGDYTCYLKWTAGRTFKEATCFPTNPWSSSSSSAAAGGAGGGEDDDRSSRLTSIVRSPSASTWRLQDLDDAISTLYLYASGRVTDAAAAAAAIATCDMMVISAAMFPYIERRLSSGMWSGNGVADDPSLHELPATWPSLSAAVQESFQAAFAAPVTLPLAGGKSLLVDNVRAVVPFLPFLLYDDRCAPKKTPATPMLIRSVLEELEEQPSPSSCPQAEPTVHLAGPEGRCVDVPYGWYYSGTQVQLWSCKSGADSNQLWTLKRDGSIRSNGMCLAAKTAKPGAAVVIADCSRVTADQAAWEVRVDGTVALRSCGLVLSASSSALMAGLKVQADDRGTAQSWTPTNSTAPLDAAILGHRDLCLQVESSGAVAVAACGDGKVWSLYPDGSLRPPAWLFLQWGCLAADAATGKVTTKVCDGRGSACERWVFRNDGTILNTGTGMVLDVKPSGAKRGVVVVSKPVAGSVTQKWALVL